MNIKNSNNLNDSNSKNSVKLKFNGKAVEDNVDVELKLDDFKIDDVSLEVKQEEKVEENNLDNDLASDNEDPIIEDSDITNEVTSEDGSNDEMQDISDDESDSESKSNVDDLDETLDIDKDSNTENSDEDERKKGDSKESDGASSSDDNDSKKDGNSKDSGKNKQGSDDEDKKPNEKGNDEQSKEGKKDGKEQLDNKEDKKNNDDQSKDNKDKKNNDDQSKNSKDKKDNENNRPEQDKNKKEGQKNNTGSDPSKKDSPSNQPRQNSNRNGPQKGNNNSGKKSLKDRAKQGIKSQAQQSFNNSKLGQTINNGKEAIEKGKKATEVAIKAGKATANTIKGIINFFISTFPVSAIVLGIVLLIAFIIIVAVIVYPGKIDVNSLYASDNYSEKDNGTLNQLRKIYQKYPNGDAALAMLVVVYPHYQTLQGNMVTYYLNSGDKELDPSKVYEDADEEESKNDDEDDKSTCEDGDEECESTVSDDMYLELFRKWTYRYKFKKLMKKSNSMSEDDFIKYLRDDYIQSESSYKKLIDVVDDDKKEEFLDAVIDDLKSKKNYFTSYIYENVSCTSNEQSLGTYNSDIIKGQPVIVLKDSQSGVFSEIKAASSLYETDDLSLSLKRYAMGVAYSEVGIYVKNEAMAKAEMIAAKSFVLGRTAPGSANTMGMGFGYDQVDDKTVFYLRGNTYDQDFCDVYEGCITGRYAKSNVTAGNSEARINQKEPLDSESIENLSKWYDETMSEFIFDDKTKTFNGTQFSSYGYDLCKVGTCMSQTDAIKAAESGSTYDEILYKLAYSSFTKYDMETSNIVTVSTNCTDAKLSCGISNDDFKYYSQINEPYGSSTFCHRTDGGTIKHAGCGITSMAMVIANLADPNVTPFTTNEEAFNGGYCGNGTGTSYTYFFEAADKYNIKYTYGIKSNSTDITKASSDIINTIKKGGLVIINVNGSWLNGNSGHYIVAKGVDENENLIVADPYAESIDRPVRNNVSAKKVLTDFVNNDSGWFMFTSDKSDEIVNKYCKQSGEIEGDWFKASKYDINKVKKIGVQCPATCFSTVMAYGTLINRNTTMDSSGYHINKCLGWGKGAAAYYGTSHYYSNESEMISAIVKEIDKGNTVAVHGKSSINQHWVLAIGYSKNYVGSDNKNMKASDILTVDPYTASEKSLSQSLSGGVYISGYNNLIIWN